MNKFKNKNIFFKKTVSKLFFVLFWASFFGLVLLQGYSSAEDLLEQAFKPSINADSVINLGNNKNAVGNEIFREWSEVTFGDGDWMIERWDFVPSTQKKPPLIVRIAKTLLRFTITIAITMMLFNGIKYMLETAKGGSAKASETMKSLMFIWVWLLLALWSLAIVNLISSITISSLEMEVENASFSQTAKWCLIDQTFYPEGNDLEKIACTDGQDGIRDNDRLSAKCNYDWGWKNIDTDMQKQSCLRNLNWTFKDNVGIGCIIEQDNWFKQVLAWEQLQVEICTTRISGNWEEKKKLLQKNIFMCKKDNDRIDINQELLYKWCKNWLGGQIMWE